MDSRVFYFFLLFCQLARGSVVFWRIEGAYSKKTHTHTHGAHTAMEPAGAHQKYDHFTFKSLAAAAEAALQHRKKTEGVECLSRAPGGDESA